MNFFRVILLWVFCAFAMPGLVGRLEVVAEYYTPVDPPLVTYLHGGHGLISQRRAGVSSYYHGEGQGSIRLLTDSAGEVNSTCDYDANGNLTSLTESTENNYLYTGQQWDPYLQMYNLHARYYNPSYGRFLVRGFLRGQLKRPGKFESAVGAGGGRGLGSLFEQDSRFSDNAIQGERQCRRTRCLWRAGQGRGRIVLFIGEVESSEGRLPGIGKLEWKVLNAERQMSVGWLDRYASEILEGMINLGLQGLGEFELRRYMKRGKVEAYFLGAHEEGTDWRIRGFRLIHLGDDEVLPDITEGGFHENNSRIIS